MSTDPQESPSFADMTRRQKLVFVLKVAVCLLSFGFIYPNIMND